MKNNNIIFLRIIFAILLVSTFIAIFKFSNQNSTESGGVSTKAMSDIINILPIEEKKKPDLIQQCEPVLRKIAHFSIYTMVGIWTMCLLSTYKLDNKKKSIITLTVGFLYASTDEFHQSLIPGRGPSFADVLLDTSGVLYGMLLIMLILYVIKEIKNSKTITK